MSLWLVYGVSIWGCPGIMAWYETDYVRNLFKAADYVRI